MDVYTGGMHGEAPDVASWRVHTAPVASVAATDVTSDSGGPELAVASVSAREAVLWSAAVVGKCVAGRVLAVLLPCPRPDAAREYGVPADAVAKVSCGRALCAVALSVDGALLALGSACGTVAVLRVADREVVRTLRHPDLVAVAIRGAHIVTAGGRVLRLWDAAAVQPLLAARSSGGEPMHAGQVTAVLLWGSGDVLVTAGSDCLVQAWRVGRGRRELYRAFTGHRAPVTGMAGAAAADRLVTHSADGAVCVWSMREGWVGRRLVLLRSRQAHPLTRCASCCVECWCGSCSNHGALRLTRYCVHRSHSLSRPLHRTRQRRQVLALWPCVSVCAAQRLAVTRSACRRFGV